MPERRGLILWGGLPRAWLLAGATFFLGLAVPGLAGQHPAPAAPPAAPVAAPGEPAALESDDEDALPYREDDEVDDQSA